LAISLWLPWYTISFPQSALDSLRQFSQQLGTLGALVRSGAQLLSRLGPFHVTAWQAFKTTPDVLLVAAIIGGGIALLALADRAGSTSGLTMLAGAVAAGLIGYRIAVPPGQSSFVSPAWGIYVALLSSLAMLAGGFLSGRESDAYTPMATAPQTVSYPPAPAATAWDAAAPALSTAADPVRNQSIAPPG
jgi:hypothetical protein